MTKAKQENVTGNVDIADILGGELPTAEETHAKPATQVEDLSDFFDDEDDDFGADSSEKEAEILQLEGSFIGKNDFKDKNSIVVVPLNFRWTPEMWSKEVLAGLKESDPQEWKKVRAGMKGNIWKTITLHAIDFNKKALDEFNNATGDGVRNIFDRLGFMTWKGQDDEISWLASQEKNHDWFAANVENEDRRPINNFQGTITPHRVVTKQRISIPVIDALGALRIIQINLGVKNIYEKMVQFTSYQDGAMDKDDSTEWNGRAVMVTKSGSGYNFQILENDNRLTDEQKSRISTSTLASDHGFDFRNLFAFGESKRSEVRGLVLDFLGLREAFTNR